MTEKPLKSEQDWIVYTYNIIHAMFIKSTILLL